jgi:hypothetical protein
MRRFDKNKHIANANQLAEERYLKSKGLLSEEYPNEKEFKDINHSLDLYDKIKPKETEPKKPTPTDEGKLISEESFTDLFKFLEQDPRKMTFATAMYTNPVGMNKNIVDASGNKTPNPMWGKIFKHSTFQFRWEDTYNRAVDRTNPEHEMGTRSGAYEKIQGYDMLEKGKSGLYLPIIPTSSKAVYTISEDGSGHEPISYEEIKPYMKVYNPSSGGSGVKFRPLIVDRISKIKSGGNEWENPSFVFAGALA